MTTIRRWSAALLAAVMVLSLAACSQGQPASTSAPAAAEQTTAAPVTAAPATEAPATEAPVTEAPVTEAPKTILENALLEMRFTRHHNPDNFGQTNPLEYMLRFTYDEEGRLTAIATPMNMSYPSEMNARYTLEYENGLLVRTYTYGYWNDQQPCGKQELEYDDAGRLVKVSVYGSSMTLPLIIGADGAFCFGYAEFLQRIGASIDPPLSDNPTVSQLTEYQYDDEGRVSTATTTLSDSVRTRTYTYAEDNSGYSFVSATTDSSNGSLRYLSYNTWEFDPSGKLVLIVQKNFSGRTEEDIPRLPELTSWDTTFIRYDYEGEDMVRYTKEQYILPSESSEWPGVLETRTDLESYVECEYVYGDYEVPEP